MSGFNFGTPQANSSLSFQPPANANSSFSFGATTTAAPATGLSFGTSSAPAYGSTTASTMPTLSFGAPR